MARAKRHYIPGHVCHITHRCHKQAFLLKFAKDRSRWIEGLYRAKKRYRHLSVFIHHPFHRSIGLIEIFMAAQIAVAICFYVGTMEKTLFVSC